MQFLYATVTMAFLRICCFGCVEFGSTSIAALFRPAREKSSRESKSCGLRQPGGEKIQAWHYQKALEDKDIWCGGNSKRKKRSDYLPIPALRLASLWEIFFGCSCSAISVGFLQAVRTTQKSANFGVFTFQSFSELHRFFFRDHRNEAVETSPRGTMSDFCHNGAHWNSFKVSGYSSFNEILR